MSLLTLPIKFYILTIWIKIMNITDKYNLSMNTANISKLENTKKQYGNAKFSIEETSSVENNNIRKYDKEFEKKRLRQVSEDFEALMINQMLKEMNGVSCLVIKQFAFNGESQVPLNVIEAWGNIKEEQIIPNVLLGTFLGSLTLYKPSSINSRILATSQLF